MGLTAGERGLTNISSVQEEIREVTPGGKTIPCALPHSSTNISKRKSRSNEVYLSLSKRACICFSYFKSYKNTTPIPPLDQEDLNTVTGFNLFPD